MRQTTPNILDDVLALNAAAPAATKVAIKDIINDGGTQMRAGLNFETVSEYAEAMLAGVTFPPITLYYDGETYWLADGFHRLQAWKSVFQVAGVAGTYDPAEIPAIVRAGTRRDAILHAAGANADHGLRRTNEDKRRSVDVLLRDPEWSQWSDRVIAEACAVSHMFVSNLRKKMTVNGLQSPTERKGADGRTINTQNIGSNRPATAPARRTLDTWIMQSIVEAVRAKLYGDLDLKTEDGLRMTARYLREDARNRSGLLWRECVERANAQGEWTHNTLVQAINNLANILEERSKAILAAARPSPLAPDADSDLHTGAGRTPPPPLTVAEIVEELTPHLVGFAPGNIAGAALGEQNDVAERCALVLSDFTYQQADLRRALQRISNDRHLAMTKEASAAVANVDRPLPAWAADPQPQPATVAQTVADVVEVHGEPQMEPQAAAAPRPAHLDDRDWELRRLEDRIDKLLAGLKEIERPFGDLTGLHTQVVAARHGLETMRRTVRTNLGIND